MYIDLRYVQSLDGTQPVQEGRKEGRRGHRRLTLQKLNWVLCNVFHKDTLTLKPGEALVERVGGVFSRPRTRIFLENNPFRLSCSLV